MASIHTISTTHVDAVKAFQELQTGLHNQPKMILFFSSTKQDFHKLSQLFYESYPHAEILGLTTSGELNSKGFIDNSVIATSFEGKGFSAKGVMIEDIVKYPIFYRDKIINALREVGINRNSQQLSKEGIGLVFPCGLTNAEEKMLSVVNSVFEKEGFPLFGGTAGDDLQFKETLISYNGKVSSKGGLIAFIKTNDDFYIQKENIFGPTGKRMKFTKTDLESRTVFEINGKTAANEYARLLGVPVNQLGKYTMIHPIGRVVNDEIYIASPFQILPNGAVQFYCQIFENSVAEILEPKNPVEILNATVTKFKNKFERLDGVLAVNCILRKLQFYNDKITDKLNHNLGTLPNLSGFVSYGEQLNNTLLNQTLILLGFGKVK